MAARLVPGITMPRVSVLLVRRDSRLSLLTPVATRASRYSCQSLLAPVATYAPR